MIFPDTEFLFCKKLFSFKLFFTKKKKKLSTQPLSWNVTFKNRGQQVWRQISLSHPGHFVTSNIRHQMFLTYNGSIIPFSLIYFNTPWSSACKFFEKCILGYFFLLIYCLLNQKSIRCLNIFQFFCS